MKNLWKILTIFVAATTFSGCDMGSNSDEVHKKSYEPITGKFVLHDSTNNYSSCTDAYFVLDGSKGNFSLKYYENGELKRDGQFQRVVTRIDRISKSNDNLHFNVKCGSTVEHISTFTESFEPLNQFRIIEEYNGLEQRYFLSELPFIMGTYVREGIDYKEETVSKRTSTSEDFTSDLNGKYMLDETHYFYFMFPEIDDYYAKAFFQYYSPDLVKPKEGFADGRTYKNVTNRPEVELTYSRQVQIYKRDHDSTQDLLFGYYTFDEEENMIDHWGTANYSDGHLNSFTFVHLSRCWSDAEMDKFMDDGPSALPDAIDYAYVGGTYTRV